MFSEVLVLNTAPASVGNCKCGSFALVLEFASQILLINSELNSFVMQMTCVVNVLNNET